MVEALCNFFGLETFDGEQTNLLDEGLIFFQKCWFYVILGNG